jgi:hypothetical protein
MAGIKPKPLRYPEEISSQLPVVGGRAAEILAEENGRRLRMLYRRLFNRAPAFESSATEPLVRELELQAAMQPEIYRALLAQQPEFHNKPGRPVGSESKNRKPEDDSSKEARRKRRERKRDKN